MNMKNTKAILLIVLGSFIIATGFAFAEAPKPAIEQLKELQIEMPVISAPSKNITKETATPVQPAAQPAAPVVPAPTVAPAPEVKPAPTLGETVKKFVGDNFSQIVTAGVIGALAFMVIGTGGAGLVVGLLAFAFFSLIKHL